MVPELNAYTLKNILKPSKMYNFSSLGFKTHTFAGTDPVPQGFNFRLPSDSHLSPNNQAVLSLNIAYGAAMTRGFRT